MNTWNITRQSQFSLPNFLLVGGRFQVIVTIDAYLSERFQKSVPSRSLVLSVAQANTALVS